MQKVWSGNLQTRSLMLNKDYSYPIYDPRSKQKAYPKPSFLEICGLWYNMLSHDHDYLLRFFVSYVLIKSRYSFTRSHARYIGGFANSEAFPYLIPSASYSGFWRYDLMRSLAIAL